MTKKTAKISPSSSDRRDHLANERTFLAWIRTSIGIMAFGFVVEKFGLFIKQIGYFLAAQGLPQTSSLAAHREGYSPAFGICLVGLGALIGFLAFLKYLHMEKQIEEGAFHHSTKLAIATTVLIVVMGAFLVIYLLRA